ncbi:MAG TPA: hypothetical protein PLC65_08290, partial [Bacteroidia bacterium]|nr:hypothetical protein [Bacteroidia bacterium]
MKFLQTTALNYEFAKNKYWNNDVLQAYRLYVLALAGQPSMSAMNRLREFYSISEQARWLLAGAYAKMG